MCLIIVVGRMRCLYKVNNSHYDKKKKKKPTQNAIHPSVVLLS